MLLLFVQNRSKQVAGVRVLVFNSSLCSGYFLSTTESQWKSCRPIAVTVYWRWIKLVFLDRRHLNRFPPRVQTPVTKHSWRVITWCSRPDSRGWEAVRGPWSLAGGRRPGLEAEAVGGPVFVPTHPTRQPWAAVHPPSPVPHHQTTKITRPKNIYFILYCTYQPKYLWFTYSFNVKFWFDEMTAFVLL